MTLLAKELGKRGKVLVVDADESNPGLVAMLGMEPPEQTIMEYLGGKPAVREKLLAMIRGVGSELVQFFEEGLALEELKQEYTSRIGNLYLSGIGKIDHSMEGCACPMGAVARDLLNKLHVDDGEWVLVDTEAGIEHFGRGVMEGADLVLTLVDPSREAVVLAEKATGLAGEVGKAFGVVLSKVDEETEPRLKEVLSDKGLEIWGRIPYVPRIAQANLEGEPLEVDSMTEELHRILSAMKSRLS